MHDLGVGTKRTVLGALARLPAVSARWKEEQNPRFEIQSEIESSRRFQKHGLKMSASVTAKYLKRGHLSLVLTLA